MMILATGSKVETNLDGIDPAQSKINIRIGVERSDGQETSSFQFADATDGQFRRRIAWHADGRWKMATEFALLETVFHFSPTRFG